MARMRSGFSYSDAVKLLGGDTEAAKLVDRLSSAGVMLTGGVDLIDARAEVVRHGKDLVRSVRARVQGMSRIGRTQLLEAAHSVIVVTAFFDALAELELPVDVKLSKPEQLGVLSADPVPVSRTVDLVGELLRWDTPQPSAEWPFPELVAALTEQYRSRVRTFVSFVSGLAGWDELDARRRQAFVDAVTTELPDRAIARYQDMYRKLAVDCPEFAVWTQLAEHAATRTRLADLRALLERVTSGEQPTAQRDGLAKAYEAALDRPLVETGDLPRDLVVPALRSAYVAPVFKVAEVGRWDDIGVDSWWSGVPVRDDVQDFLAGYLTSSRAVEAPLLVLGQPGSGKSVLTKVIAASLPSADFLPIRVVLRDVPAEADLQEQIEHAVRAATGERVNWPDLARSAGKAVPVVLLDGFDELLQATGVGRSDYLTKIAEFQDRERTQGRAVIVVVTSRLAVAHRARVPDGTTALRLEPFGEAQVAQWLEGWNTANADYLRSNELAPLDAEKALQYDDLAKQPLLLFMLALFDLDGNALQGQYALRRTDLYEGLLHRFAVREVERESAGLTDEEIRHRIDHELTCLSVVAFAMFNRGTQWVEEESLDSDLTAFQLSSARLVLERFFFVHEAGATHGNVRVRTYEFLHATFGEYLVARLVHRLLDELPRSGDAMLHTLLSFTPLSTRTAVLTFLSELGFRRDRDERDALRPLLVRLLRESEHPRADTGHACYQPRPTTVPRRIAVYSANLVQLLIRTAGGLSSDELDAEDPVARWTSLTYLWRSQLTEEEWQSFVAATNATRDADGSFVVRSPQGVNFTEAGRLISANHLHGAGEPDPITHVLMPLVHTMRGALNRTRSLDGTPVAPMHLLLDAWSGHSEPDETYHACLLAATNDERYWELVLQTIAHDPAVSSDVALLALFVGAHKGTSPRPLADCALLLLQRGEHSGVVFDVLDQVLGWDGELMPPLFAHVLVRLIELGLRDDLHRVHEFEDPVAYLNLGGVLASVAELDRPLYARLRWAMQEIGLADRVNWL